MEADPLAGGTLDEASLASGKSSRRVAGSAAEAETRALSRNRQVQRCLLVIGVAVFVTSATGRVSLNLTSARQPWDMLDLQIYRWAGLIARHSGDLYGAHFPYHHLRFTYPPIAGLIFASFSVLPMPVLGWLFTGASITSLVATFWLMWGILGYRQPGIRISWTLLAAGVALWFGPVQQTLGFGQVNLMLMLVIIADFRLPDSSWAKGIGVGLAAGFKLTPLIFIPYLLLTRRFLAAGVALGTFALTIVASLVLLPSQSSQFWFGGLFLNSGRTGNNAYVGNQSLNGALIRLLGNESAAWPYWLVVSVVVAALGLLLAARWTRQGCEMIGILTCALTGLLISPVSWAHHWVWIAPAAAVVIDLAVRHRFLLWSPQGVLGELGRAKRWLPWAYVSLAVFLAIPFCTVPESLVPAPVTQGHDAHGIQLLTSNAYIIAGLVALCLLGLASMRVSTTRDEAGVVARNASLISQAGTSRTLL